MYISVMQDRLAQQQKAMADERAYLKEIISRMDTQINEQQRQLEKVRVTTDLKIGFQHFPYHSTNAYIDTTETKTKAKDWRNVYIPQERWKMTAEQAKAESTQRALEEERRSLSMQINMEREELERAKVRMTSADRIKELILIPCICPLPLLPVSLSIRVHYWRSRNQWCSAARRRGGNWQPSGPTSTPRRSRGMRGLSGRSTVS